MEITFSINEIKTVAKKVLNHNSNKVILLEGEMGVGKTTLIKELVKELGVIERISSPTFSLVNEYQTTDNQIIFHFDFYRIKKESEALDMGIDEYLYSGNWCFIEWAENIPSLIPKKHSKIKIQTLTDGNRTIEFANF